MAQSGIVFKIYGEISVEIAYFPCWRSKSTSDVFNSYLKVTMSNCDIASSVEKGRIIALSVDDKYDMFSRLDTLSACDDRRRNRQISRHSVLRAIS